MNFKALLRKEETYARTLKYAKNETDMAFVLKLKKELDFLWDSFYYQQKSQSK